MNIDQLSLEDWKRAESIFHQLFRKEGYDAETSANLAFYLAQTLWNAEPIYKRLLAKIASGEEAVFTDGEHEEIMIQIHSLFQNHDNLSTGHKMLMYE
jgi:hypothetical protein